MIQLFINILATSAFYILLGSGFNTTSKVFKFANFAYGDLVILSSYVWYAILGFNFIQPELKFIIVSVICVLICLFVYLILFKNLILKKDKSLEIIITCISLSTIIVSVIQMFFGNQVKTLEIKNKIWDFSTFSVSSFQFLQIGLSLFILLYLFLFRKTASNIYLKAFSSNLKLLQSLGINTEKIKICIFGVLGVLLSVVGLFSGIEQNLQVAAGLVLTLKAYAVNSFFEAPFGFIFASFFLAGTENLVIYFLGGEFKNGVTFGLLILMLGFLKQPKFKLFV